MGLIKGLNRIFFFPPAGIAADASDKAPLVVKWWTCLLHVDAECLSEMFRYAVPREVQKVLGQETFGVTDLLRLVGDWRDPPWRSTLIF